MSTVAYGAAIWRLRTAIRRQLAADMERVRQMESELAVLERHIAEARRRLAALDFAHPSLEGRTEHA